MAAVVVLALAVASQGAVAALYVSFPRDDAAFLAQLETWGGKRLRAAVTADPDQVVAEGERACAWLRRQPWEFYNRFDEVGVWDLEQRYLDETLDATLLDLPRRYLATDVDYVAAVAWRHLCRAPLELRTTHIQGRGGD